MKERVKLVEQLALNRCPHCSVDRPTLTMRANFATTAQIGSLYRHWLVYACNRCGGVVAASTDRKGGLAKEIFPHVAATDESVPQPARDYLEQARDTLHAPAGSVMLAASAVDAMLKEKGYKEGNLFSRIEAATSNHLLTKEMAAWAHEVRLDANDQRHADEDADLPTTADAKKTLEFTLSLAEYLFVLPSRVERGRTTGKRPESDSN